MARGLALILVLAGALWAARAGDRPLPRADLVWIEPADFNTLDPVRMSHLPDFRIATALFEGLLRLDTASPDLAPIPALARSWRVSPDGRTYTFRLDPAAKWSNGDAVTAGDFVYAWRRALLPETGADYLRLFQWIDGGREFTEWRAAQTKAYATLPEARRTPEAARALTAEMEEAFARLVGVRAIDANALEVRLRAPMPYFLDLCAFPAFFPVHPPSVEAFVDADPATGLLRQRHGWTKPGRLVGNGPYVLERWRFKRDLRLGPNPHFRDATLARSRTIEVRVVENPTTALLAFQGGAADWHSDLEVPYAGDLLKAAEAGSRNDVRALHSFGTYSWSFNCTPRLPDGRANPFADARVRRAFALATDREAITSNVRRGAERAARTLIPPGSIPGYRSPQGLGTDPARARRDLEAAGWRDRDGDGAIENERGEAFPVVEMLITPSGPHRDVAQALGRMWGEALGVRTTIVMRETKVYRESLKNRDYMVARGAWFGDYLDPTTFLDIHRTGDGNNDRGFSSEAYDALLARAEAEPDPAARLRLLESAERMLVEDDMPVLPIWHYAQYYLCRPPDAPGGLRGLSTHPRLIQYPFLLEVAR